MTSEERINYLSGEIVRLVNLRNTRSPQSRQFPDVFSINMQISQYANERDELVNDNLVRERKAEAERILKEAEQFKSSPLISNISEGKTPVTIKPIFPLTKDVIDQIKKDSRGLTTLPSGEIPPGQPQNQLLLGLGLLVLLGLVLW